MQKLPSLQELLEAGVHFGHKTSRWYPKMRQYIYGARQDVHILNLEKTLTSLEKALAYVKGIAASGGVVLFVGTKAQAAPAIRKYALEVGMPYVDNRWLGGTFTNLPVITALIKKLDKLEQERDSGDRSKYTKKEQLDFDREIVRLTTLVGGIRTISKLPQAIFLVGLKEEKTVSREAVKTHVPIIALCDSNTNPTAVAYPIPANDDGIKSIELITKLVAEAIREGKQEGARVAAAAAMPTVEEKPVEVA